MKETFICHLNRNFSSNLYSIGGALMDLVGVFTAIEDQHMNVVSELNDGAEKQTDLKLIEIESLKSILFLFPT